MFNVTVINAKKSIIKIAVIISILITVFATTTMINKFKTNDFFQVNISEQLIKCVNNELPAIESTYYKSNNTIIEDGEEEKETFVGKILKIELAQVHEKEKGKDGSSKIAEEEPKTEEKDENNEETDNNISTEVSSNLPTEIVTQNSIAENYGIDIDGVKIKNETSFEIDNSILDVSQNINKRNVLIFHTHTCESYTPSEKYQYEQTGNFRTTDLNFSVARVGDELENYLKQYSFNVIHDKTYHDYPAYSGSYNRSRVTVENILKDNSSDIIIDLHRDAIGSKSNYDPSVKIGDEVAAQLMFVMGTNGGGLQHSNWKSNLKFAIEVQKKANEMYPGLFKPIIVRNSRYNQHLGSAACIIEVGATGNTLEQCLTSMKFLAKVLNDL